MSGNPSTVTVCAVELRAFAADLFQAAGVNGEESQIVASSLVESNLCGHDSHGIMRIAEYLPSLTNGSLRAGVELLVLNQTSSMLVCDAQFGFGQVQMRRLINRLEPMARSQGIACGTIRRCGHVGRLGEWVEVLARRNLAGLMSVNDNGVLTCVAPPGGIDPRISTNPIALGVPTDGEPLVLDISTSVVANGKIRVAKNAGRSCPEGWLQDSSGRPTTDPSTRFADPPGTILPMGGYKGFGLGLLLDVLVGGLSGGQCPPAPSGELDCNNVLLLAFDPGKFCGLEHFVEQSQGLCDFTRTSRLVDSTANIRLPGDHSQQTHKTRMCTGIEIDAGTWGQLLAHAKCLKVAIPVPMECKSP